MPSPIGRNRIAPKGLIILGHEHPYVLIVYTLQLHAESGNQDLLGILILEGELCFTRVQCCSQQHALAVCRLQQNLVGLD